MKLLFQQALILLLFFLGFISCKKDDEDVYQPNQEESLLMQKPWKLIRQLALIPNQGEEVVNIECVKNDTWTYLEKGRYNYYHDKSCVQNLPADHLKGSWRIENKKLYRKRDNQATEEQYEIITLDETTLVLIQQSPVKVTFTYSNL